ncbi:MAG: B3/B4 domain-containing protein [Hyphomicrobiales bacterium]
MKGDISAITGRFPDVRIAFVVARRLEIAAARSAALEAAIGEVQSALRSAHSLDEVGGMPGIAAWRMVYRAFGIKKTSYRSSVERLVRNVLRDRDLPRINGLVDCYNMISLKHVLPAGADDADRISGDIGFRFATGEESFIPLGSEDMVEDPPKPGEVVYADAEKVLCRRWNWYQDARSPVVAGTRTAVITVQCAGSGNLDPAVKELTGALLGECAGEGETVVADAAIPVVDLPGI